MYSASFQTLSAVSLPFPRWVAPRPFPLRVSTVSSTVSTLYTHSHLPRSSLPSVIYLQLAAYRSLVSLFPFFFFFPSFSPPLFPFLWKEYPLTPYPARSLPLCAHPLPASHPAFTCSPLPRIMATTLPHGIGGNGIAALGFRWMWYFRFAADSFAMCFPSFVFSSPLFFFFFWWFYLFLGFSFGKNSLMNLINNETNKISIWVIIRKNNKIWDI